MMRLTTFTKAWLASLRHELFLKQVTSPCPIDKQLKLVFLQDIVFLILLLPILSL